MIIVIPVIEEPYPDHWRFSASKDREERSMSVGEGASRRSSHPEGSESKEATCSQDEGFLANLWLD